MDTAFWPVLMLLFLSVPGLADPDPGIPITSPPPGSFYHMAFTPVIHHRSESEITTASISSYEDAVGKKIAIGVISNEWGVNRTFPTQQADIIRRHGAVPYIRLMTRTDIRQYNREPMFTVSRIRDGYYDKDLTAWAESAKAFKTPLIVEWGTEVNGYWFPWNGFWNGQDEGPERFRDAYRHIITLMETRGADNLLWVYHVNWNSMPDVEWNTISSYYPGDEYIDWVGISVYGAQDKNGIPRANFSEQMNQAYPELIQTSRHKPLIISEFGTDIKSPHVDPEIWTEDALREITSGKWPEIIGMCWWNAGWPNDRNPGNNTTMRIEESEEIQKIFLKYIGNNPDVLPVVITQSGQTEPPAQKSLHL